MYGNASKIALNATCEKLAVSIGKWSAASESFVENGMSQQSILPKANKLKNFSVLKHALRSTK